MKAFASGVLALVGGLGLFLSSLAHANLVQNNSFEDDGINGDTLICPMTGWGGCAGINAGETANLDPILIGHGGYLAIGTVGTLGYVSQNIPTVIGQLYRFTFMFSSDGNPSNKFQALWDSNVLMDVSGTPYDPNWTFFGCPFINDPQYESCIQGGHGGPAYYSFDITAASTLSTISFGGQGDRSGTSYVGIDEVFVTPIFEPGAFSLFASGMMGLLFVRRRSAIKVGWRMLHGS
ncbi:MAG: hypothetical protein WBQ75_20330 [Acetobacteraceae bacterium]